MHFSLKCALGLAALGLAAPAARAQTQDLFVSNTIAGTISRFAGTGPGTYSTTATTFTTPGLSAPTGLAFDASGDLFVADENINYIREFTAGATPGTFGAVKVLIGLSDTAGLAFDARGDLFASNPFNFRVTEFPAGAAPGTFGAINTLSGGGLSQPQGLAVDAKGDLFVADSRINTVDEFVSTGAGTFAPPTVFATGLNGPVGLAVDAGGDLFVSNANGNSITEFPAGAAPGTFGATRTLSSGGLNVPEGLAVDAGGNLFVANLSNNTGVINGGTVTEFPVGATPGTFGAGSVVETGLSNPSFLTFGPSASAPVPEASTTVSLGLLLGVGGVAIAARKKRKA